MTVALQKKICKDGRIWGQNNKEAGDHIGILRRKNTPQGLSVGKYIRTIEIKNKNSCAVLGYKNYNFGKIPWNKGITHTEETKKKFRERKGNKNPNWKGGITSLTSLIRKSENNKKWIQDVLKRDNYVCQECQRSGVFLEAHHIKQFNIIFNNFLKDYSQFSPIEDKETLVRLSFNYEQFWDINNGVTLCKECHNLTKGIRK